jgi:hypothetical protein
MYGVNRERSALYKGVGLILCSFLSYGQVNVIAHNFCNDHVLFQPWFKHVLITHSWKCIETTL